MVSHLNELALVALNGHWIALFAVVTRKTIILLSWIGLFASTVLAQKQPAAAQSPSVTWKAPADANAADYVGVEMCSGCHQDEAQQFAKTVHAKTYPATAKFGTGCESCHGPGKAHTDAMIAAGGDPQKTEAGRKLIWSFQGKPADNSARCLHCHSSGHDQSLFSRSQHKLVGVSCEQCHSAHLLTSSTQNAGAKLRPAQEQFFHVAFSFRRNALAARKPSQEEAAGPLFYMPCNSTGQVCSPHPPPRSRRSDEVHRLP